MIDITAKACTPFRMAPYIMVTLRMTILMAKAHFIGLMAIVMLVSLNTIKFNGIGTFTWADGSEEGLWSNGEFVKSNKKTHLERL